MRERWTIRPKSGAERLLDFLLCLSQCAGAAETLRGGDNIQAGGGGGVGVCDGHWIQNQGGVLKCAVLGRRRRLQRRQGHGGFRREQKKRQSLLQIKPDSGFTVTVITDRDVLAEMQREVAAASG